jgi:hypothetical protein
VKLNPEDLEIVSFPTDPQLDTLSPSIVDTLDPNHPTPRTYCFVCD